MDIYSCIKQVSMLGFITLGLITPAFTTNAMQQDPLLTCSVALTNQLQKFCSFQKSIIQANELAARDALVEKAKQRIRDNAGSFDNETILLLKSAATKNNPEAVYLLGDRTPEAENALQEYRCEKGYTELQSLISIVGENEQLFGHPFICNSEAYRWFSAILNHSYSNPYGPEQCEILANASYNLGMMSILHFGIPLKEANYEVAQQYLKKALALGNQAAQVQLDNIAQFLQPKTTKTPVNTITQQIPEITLSPIQEPVNQEQTPIIKQQGQQPTKPELPEKLITPNQSVSSLQEQPCPQTIKTYAAAVKTTPMPAITAKKPTATPNSPVKALPVIKTNSAEQIQILKPKQDKQPTKVAPPKTTITPIIKILKREKPQLNEDTPVKHTNSTTFIEKSEPAQEPIQKTEEPTVSKHEKKQPTQNKTKPKAPSAKKNSAGKPKVQKLTEKPKHGKKESKPTIPAVVSTVNVQEKKQTNTAYNLVSKLITHYIDKTQSSVILTELCQRSDCWHTPQAVYQGSYKIIEKENVDCPELMGILLYLQNNLPEAHTRLGSPKGTFSSDTITNWYRALLLLTEQPASERTTDILSALKDTLSHAMTNYSNIKELLFLDGKLISFVQEITKENNSDSKMAKVIISHIGMLFGCEVTGMRPEEIESCLMKTETDDAYILLAEMYSKGILVKQSLKKALSIIQKITVPIEKISSQQAARVIPLLNDIINNAEILHENIILLDTLYLKIICEAALKDAISICELLDKAEKLIQSMPQSKKSFTSLFIDSGAYQAILPLINEFPQLLFNVGLILCDRALVHKCPMLDYSDVLERGYLKAQDISNSVNSEGSGPEDKQLAQKAGDFLEQYIALQCITDNFSQLRKSNQQAIDPSLQETFNTENNTGISASDEEESIIPPERLLELAKKAIQENHYEGLKDLLNNYLNIVENNAKESGEKVQISPLLFELLEMLKQKNSHEPLIIVQTIQEHIEKMSTGEKTKNKNVTPNNKKQHQETEIQQQWNNALKLFSTQKQTPERDTAILAAMDKALFFSIADYHKFKTLLSCPDNLAKFVVGKWENDNNIVAATITSRIGLLFGSHKIGMDPICISLYLNEAAEKNSVNACLCYSEMFTQGMIVAKSLQEAAKLLTKAMFLEANTPETKIMLLNQLSCIQQAAGKENNQSVLFAMQNLEALSAIETTLDNCDYLQTSAALDDYFNKFFVDALAKSNGGNSSQYTMRFYSLLKKAGQTNDPQLCETVKTIKVKIAEQLRKSKAS